MASIRKEILIQAAPEAVWDAVRDVGALHTRLVPGFVTDTVLEPDARLVTFGSGLVVKELIVDCDDAARRLVWSARGGRLTHHNGALEVREEGAGWARVVWTADLLPHELRETIAGMMDQGLSAMKAALEVAAASAGQGGSSRPML
jgi:carbon monoxide dehydrogenase subunit G